MNRLLSIAVILSAVHTLHADQSVESLQQTLKQQGCYYGKVTGEKSTETTAAIRRYQIRNGLKVTGALNDETTRSLNASGNSVAAASQTSSKPVTPQINSAHPENTPSTFSLKSAPSFREAGREMETNPSYAGSFSQPRTLRPNRRSISEAQYQLLSRGYYRGRVDGKYGRETAFALRAFQSGAGLLPTGRLDPETLNALGSSGTDFAYLAPPSHGYEVWMPVRKFKNGKWKVKWKRYLDSENAGEDRQANRESGWNPYNED